MHKSHMAVVAKGLTGIVATLLLMPVLTESAEMHAKSRSVDLLVEDIEVIDMTGSPPIENAAIAVADGRIVAVGRELDVRLSDDGVRLDGEGRFAIPGLSDMHVHLGLGGLQSTTPAGMERALRQFTFNGVTRVFSVGGTGGQAERINAFRREIESGSLPGPTVHGTGSMLTLPGSHPVGTIMSVPQGVDAEAYDWRERGVILVASIEEARAAVRDNAEAGMGAIKIIVESGPTPFGDDHPQMPPGMIAAVVEEADSFDLPVVAHASSHDELVSAMDNGAHAIMHAVGEPFPGKQILEQMADQDVYYVPTLSLFAAVMGVHWQPPDATNDGFLRAGVDDATLASLGAWQPPMAASGRRQLWREMLDSIARAHAAGVPIALGTDTNNPYVFPGYSAHVELELLVEAGLTPMEALTAGTRTAASMLGHENEYGTLQPGKRADILLLEDDPLEDIRATRTLSTVVQRGKLVDRQALLSDP